MKNNDREFKLIFKEVNGVPSFTNEVKGEISMPDIAAVISSCMLQYENPVKLLEYLSQALHLQAQQLIADDIKEKNGL